MDIKHDSTSSPSMAPAILGEPKKADVSMTPLPRGQINCVILVQTCEALQINILFPFVAFMVEDMGYSGEQLGYYSGFLAASFCFAQFFSCVPWGLFSDKFGRKPAIIAGTLGSAVGMLVFGTATSYHQAMIGRMLSGFLSGNVGILKSFLTEITDDTNRGAGFAYMSISWALGCIIAPISGGLLCRPAMKYPFIFSESGVFGEYPYLLPCLLCAMTNTITALLSMFYLKESRIFHDQKGSKAGSKTGAVVIRTATEDAAAKRKKDQSLSNRGSIELARIKSLVSPTKAAKEKDVRQKGEYASVGDQSSHGEAFCITDDEEDEEDVDNITAGQEREGLGFGRYKSSDPDNTVKESPMSVMQLGSDVGDLGDVVDIGTTDIKKNMAEEDAQYSDSDSDEDEEICCRPVVDCCTGIRLCGRGTTINGELAHNAMHSNLHEGALNDTVGTKENTTLSKKAKHSVLLQKTVLTATFSYGMLAMSYILLDETMPLFLKYDVLYGGFSFNTNQIGLLLSISGLVMFLFNMYFLPTIASISKRKLFFWGSMAGIPVALLFPFLSLINYHMTAFQREFIMFPLLCLNMVFKSIAATLCFLAVMIQVNHSVHSEHLGIVNGLGQSFAALMRAVGPAMGGLLWSLCVKENFVFFNFLAVCFIFVVNMVINKSLPATLDSKKLRRSERNCPGRSPEAEIPMGLE